MAPPRDPVELLRDAQRIVAKSTQHVRAFACGQTIERTISTPLPPAHFETCEQVKTLFSGEKSVHLVPWVSDRLRLQVLVSDRTEHFSWAGGNGSASPRLDDLVGSGMVASGDFSALLTSIFVEDIAAFQYVGEVEREGRRLAQYTFEVSKGRSHYSIRSASQTGDVVVGFRGIAWIAWDNAELVALKFNPVDIPGDAGACSIEVSMEYPASSPLIPGVLLPRRTTTTQIDLQARQYQNETIYTACREFQAEARLILPTETRVPTSREQAGTPIPPGLELKLVLDRPINPESAAAGDSVTATLARPLRTSDHRVIAPRGAKARGLIVRLERYYYPSIWYRLALRFNSLETEAGSLVLKAVPLSSQGKHSGVPGFPESAARRSPVEGQQDSEPFQQVMPRDASVFVLSQRELRSERLTTLWLSE